MNDETRERITLVSKKDLEISYFCGSGAGGQARNKVASGVLIRHPESGAIGRASDSRSQHDNKRAAFKRLVADPRMKFYLSRQLYEIRQGETLADTVNRDMATENLRIETRNADGLWEVVKNDIHPSA